MIGDVCDKGLGAALFMTLFRSLLRAASKTDFYMRVGSTGLSSPAARLRNAVSLTNNYIAETHGSTSMFATVFLGILDMRSGTLAFINCGHLPPLVINRCGVKRTLHLTGPVLGAFVNAEHAVNEVELAPGDMLFAYTDGLTDTESAGGEILGIEELMPLLTEEKPLCLLLDRVLRRAKAHAENARQFDDITLLAVRRRN